MTATSSAPTPTILQAFRAMTHQGASTPTAPQMTVATINIKSRFDPLSGQQIILWNDIIKVFKYAEYVQYASTFVPYLANDDFEDLIPLRIAAHPGVVLEVVISNPGDAFQSEVNASASSTNSLSINEDPQGTSSRLYPAPNGSPIPSHPPPSYEQSTASPLQSQTDRTPISSSQHLPSSSSSSSSSPSTRNYRFQLFAPHLENSGANNLSTIGVAQHRTFVVVGDRLSTNFTSSSSSSPTFPPRVRSRRSLPAAPSQGSTACDLESVLTSLRLSHPPSTRTSQIHLQTLFDMANPADQELTGDTEADIDSFLQTTRTLYWHEAPMPRLFIVLPTMSYYNDRSHPVLSNFRFFWMCEFTGHCGNSQLAETTRGFLRRLPHLYHHDSLELVRPQAFFEKYGDHLLQTMLTIKYGGTDDREPQGPYPSLLSQTGLDHVPGIQILQGESGLSRQNVELHLDLMIRHLQRLRSTTHNTHNTTHAEGFTTPLPRKPLVSLQYSDLTQLQSFLAQRRTSTIRSTTTDTTTTLHRQYRVVNKQGHVHWICRSHMNSLQPHFNPEQIQRFVVGQYNYSSQRGELMIFSRSNLLHSVFHSAIIAKATCVTELIIDLQSGMSASEFYSLRDAVLPFGLFSLDIRNLEFIAPAAAERRPVSTLIFNTNSGTNRGDPYRLLQSYSNTLWQLLNDHPLQSLRLNNATHLLTQDWVRKPIRSFRLRRICLTICTKGGAAVPIRQGVLNIVSNSPHLQDLKIVWNDLEEAMGEEHLLNTLLDRNDVNPAESTNVCFVMSDRSTSLVIKNELLVNVCLTAASLPSLAQQFLAKSGQLNGGRLTINSMAIWGLTSPYIMMLLAKNPGLASLDLQYPIEDFEKTEQFIIQTLLHPASGYGNSGGYQLQEFTLRDSRGRNDISARYIIPAYSPSQPLERSSVKMLVDMVLVETTDPGYHSFFWAHGHAVKSLILTQDTASTILSIFDKATTNSTSPAQHRGALQLTSLVVSLKGLNIASTFHLYNIIQRSKSTFKQLVLCGDIPLRSHFETESLLNLLPAFAGEQVVLLRESRGVGTTMQEWEDLVRRLLPEEVVLTLAEDRRDLCRHVPGLSMSIAEHL
ncbi:MAG: hypothetical protein JOS17DRAFT_844953 [Linnemannia elongata]|nr:MAG: hypothetical protein JOS17DRAFT_844953 [Linnemannia elongata]